ncbi:hypothetical protein SAMN02745146_3436 [Hymenobacter daecheongensis DSM 21074]|uniref:Carboxypeptidase regulatory-like domain-containing protein n=1 Tax=Hymenobacter daecheongensis DSM 21074 TaxID=1121955 RepID=A0A1M6KHA1_9BACT|nr:hypothetical protein [Hymenobacter daecheongensis]SHJ58334.1 hypothetical protein SAMN02745146_3436 [Hymenobacter daecheongensis DSM 21074]
MKGQLVQLLFGISLLSLAACTKKEDQPTVVEGTVMNKFTNQPVAGIPIVVIKESSAGHFSGVNRDSLTVAYTNAAGTYSHSFNASSGNNYYIKMNNSQTLHDLSYGWYGAKATAGSNNRIDFSVTPYKIVTVNINTNKRGKSNISFDFFSTVDTDNFGGFIFSDTVSSKQMIVFTRTIKVLPNRDYTFRKYTFNQVRTSNGNHIFQDYTYTQQTRRILYNDTTVINIR